MANFLLDKLRAFKPAYAVYNLLHRGRLRHNERLYRRYGLRKAAFAPVSARDFAPLGEGEAPRFDRLDSRVEASSDPAFQAFPPETQQALLPWSAQGYVILRGFFTAEEVATINAEVARLVDSGKANWRYGAKIMFAIHQSPEIRRIVQKPLLGQVLGFLLGRPVRLFQSINFLRGSEQKAHSDSIHMTTYPLGYLIAAWIALEDVTAANGPLFYHPGSHRLPYVLNDDYPHGGSHFFIGDNAYGAYERAIAAVIEKNDLPREELHARAGDVLIWHANLLHGGAPIQDPASTRRSMVLHYFAEEVICYHEITQRPALI